MESAPVILASTAPSEYPDGSFVRVRGVAAVKEGTAPLTLPPLDELSVSVRDPTVSMSGLPNQVDDGVGFTFARTFNRGRCANLLSFSEHHRMVFDQKEERALQWGLKFPLGTPSNTVLIATSSPFLSR